ncbi:MAG: DUF2007 domain-containing protein [Firmicutes bacterium]|nr:DUF2007 domain-containing protein [Bacillota bacterium]
MADEQWVFLVEAYNDVEAQIILGLLESEGIPARKEDSDPFTGAMRVLGGQAYEINILVPPSRLEQARALLRSASEKGEDNC